MKKMVKKLSMLMIAFVMCVTLSACGSKDEEDKYDEMLERGYIVVGCDDTFAPMGFKKDGELVGYDIDLAKAMSEKMGVEFRFQTIDWTMKESELNNGSIDLIWNGYSITDKRKKQVNFTTPYLENRQVIITLKDSDIKTKADLEGKKVAVQKDSSAYDAVTADEISKKLDGGEPTQYDTNNDCFMDLEAGRSDAIVADEVLAEYYISQQSENIYVILEDNFGSEQYGIGVRKSDEKLLEALNKAYDELTKEKVVEEINEKWFGK